QLVGCLEDLGVAARQEVRSVLAPRMDGADRVDHPLRWEPAGDGGHSPAGGEAFGPSLGADALALGQDARATSPMDGPVHATAAKERGVRRVHDGVHLLIGDVAFHQLDPHAAILPSSRVNSQMGPGPTSFPLSAGARTMSAGT